MQDEDAIAKVKKEKMQLIRKLHDELVEIDPECVVFNYECCSCYSEKGFKQAGTVEFIKAILDKGFMVMCSDFSLKALIKEWDAYGLPLLTTTASRGAMQRWKSHPPRDGGNH